MGFLGQAGSVTELQSHRSGGPAGLHHQALGSVEQYLAAKWEYSRLLSLQQQARQVRSRVNLRWWTLQCRDQHSLLEVEPLSPCLTCRFLNVYSGVCKEVCVIEFAMVGLCLMAASTLQM